MKKKTLLSIIMLMVSVISFANGEHEFIGKQLELQVGYNNDYEDVIHPKPRTPEIIPIIYFDGSTLFFATSCDGCTLQIVDEMENICNEVVIPMGTQQITLPDYLVGEYGIRIIKCEIFYWGRITINNF